MGLLSKSNTKGVMSNLNCLIGDIVYGFVRIEFVLSQILSELGFRDNQIDFFAESQTKRKLEAIRSQFLCSEIDNKDEFVKLIDELNDIRNLRNIVVHSLPLTNIQNANNHMFHNYQKTRDKIIN